MLIFNFKSTVPILLQELLFERFKAEPHIHFALTRLHGEGNVISQDIGLPKRIPGQISAEHLVELKIRHAFVGHLERRIHLGESLEVIIQKANNALNNGITPILCNGLGSLDESLDELDFILNRIDIDGKEIIVAHENIGATLSGSSSASAELIATRAGLLQRRLKEIKRKGLMFGHKLIYGGGVDQQTIVALKAAEIDGFLVGDRYRSVVEIEALVAAHRTFLANRLSGQKARMRLAA